MTMSLVVVEEVGTPGQSSHQSGFKPKQIHTPSASSAADARAPLRCAYPPLALTLPSLCFCLTPPLLHRVPAPPYHPALHTPPTGAPCQTPHQLMIKAHI
jgi:hypothetical protein